MTEKEIKIKAIYLWLLSICHHSSIWDLENLAVKIFEKYENKEGN